MRDILAAARAACCVLLSLGMPLAARAQTWNDSTTRALVELATRRRAEQLADTGLTAYEATAHGYVTFLAQLGEGFPTPPKIVKADELELQVYWRAPNLSKQRIIGRRDTLLLPTDIQYHRDHLGIVQNNFPNIIRIGEGDEVRDVPHPLSPAGLSLYDFAVTDSFHIRSAAGDVYVHEVKVRPKDDRQPRVIGAVYIDPSGGQVVRMAFGFTRASFLDNALEDLSIVLENRLVSGRFWLPSRQEIEIRRSGTWLDYPVRGIIRGRWEIGDYNFDLKQQPGPYYFATGPEIMQAPREEQQKFPWKGKILDSLPPDVRAVTEADVEDVKAEARALVRSQALARAHRTAVSGRNISDFVRFDRVEGLALGDGIMQGLGAGVALTVRARYGIDDHDGKGLATLAWSHPSGLGLRLYGLRDFRDVSDVAERSGAVNSIAAQEFASDYTDPYLIRGAGIGVDLRNAFGLRWSLDGSVERQDALAVRARPVTGVFRPAIPAWSGRVARIELNAERPLALWLFGTEMRGAGQLRSTFGAGDSVTAGAWNGVSAVRGAINVRIERPVGADRVVLETNGAAVTSTGPQRPPQELAYFGGPISGPGYDYHSLVASRALSQRVEWRMPVPFPTVSLGRFGRVPGAATLAPYAHAVLVGGSVRQVLYPALGAAFLSPFDLIRFDVARGLRAGRWTFGVDVNREFWGIL